MKVNGGYAKVIEVISKNSDEGDRLQVEVKVELNTADEKSRLELQDSLTRLGYSNSSNGRKREMSRIFYIDLYKEQTSNKTVSVIEQMVNGTW